MKTVTATTQSRLQDVFQGQQGVAEHAFEEGSCHGSPNSPNCYILFLSTEDWSPTCWLMQA